MQTEKHTERVNERETGVVGVEGEMNGGTDRQNGTD